MPYVIGMIMGKKKIVDGLFTINALNVSADPLAAHALGGRQKRRMREILRTEEVARVIEDGGGGSGSL